MTGRAAQDPTDGPFSSREEAAAVFAEFCRAAERGTSGPSGEQLVFTGDQHLTDALTDSIDSFGVELGAYDHQLIAWLAGLLDPVDIAVICSWMRRVAHDVPDRDISIANPDLKLPEAGQ